MARRLAVLAVILCVLLCADAMAQSPLSAEEEAFFKNHISELVKLEPTRLDDRAVTRVFAVPIYSVKISLGDPESGGPFTTLVVARHGDKLDLVSLPSTDADCPNIHKMFRPDFKLNNEDVAETVRRAFDLLYPASDSRDNKENIFRRKGNEWTFIRGTFFDTYTGFVLTTDASGTITSVKFSLKLPKA